MMDLRGKTEAVRMVALDRPRAGLVLCANGVRENLTKWNGEPGADGFLVGAIDAGAAIGYMADLIRARRPEASDVYGLDVDDDIAAALAAMHVAVRALRQIDKRLEPIVMAHEDAALADEAD